MKLLFITNKKLAAVLLLCSIVIIIFAYYYIRKEETLLVSAKRVLNAIENGNVSLLTSYMREEEVKILELNEEKLTKFLDAFKMRMNGFEKSGDMVLTPSPPLNALILQQEYKHTDGRRSEITITVIRTEKGNKIVSTLYPLFVSMLLTYWDGSKPYPSGIKKMEFFGSATLQAIPTLKQTGISGFVRTTGKDLEFEYLSWDDYREYCVHVSNRNSVN